MSVVPVFHLVVYCGVGRREMKTAVEVLKRQIQNALMQMIPLGLGPHPPEPVQKDNFTGRNVVAVPVGVDQFAKAEKACLLTAIPLASSDG